MEHSGSGKRYLVAGVDEAGRGPLAGSVVAAAVILDPEHKIAGITDSKAIAEDKREELAELIRERALAWAVAETSVAEIDQLNILHASMLAMARAIEQLPTTPDHCLIDGNRCPVSPYNCQAVVKGDTFVQEISAASILAKVSRDRTMHELHKMHPQYGFDRHKGYPTKQHLQALEEYGVLEHHRRSFGPVRSVIARTECAGESR
ncbi:ribonuclease HII [Chromatiales bacterium (ex Bugula neritina AB1)]|nr:ribonuclease HII [Chromatiales bacterium (ex Bugula neritina AB1)]